MNKCDIKVVLIVALGFFVLKNNVVLADDATSTVSTSPPQESPQPRGANSPQFLMALPRIPTASERAEGAISGTMLRSSSNASVPTWENSENSSFGNKKAPAKKTDITSEDNRGKQILNDASNNDIDNAEKSTDVQTKKFQYSSVSLKSDTKQKEDDTVEVVKKDEIEVKNEKKELTLEQRRLRDDVRRKENALAFEEEVAIAKIRKKRDSEEAERELYSRSNPVAIQEALKPTTEGNKKIIYRLSSKQKNAIKEELPNVPNVTRPYYKTQITPPNISQKVYYGSNAHLIPVTFQYELDAIAFSLTEKPDDLPKLRAMLSKVSSINMQTNHGNTLLINSIVNRNQDAVLVLLQHGADVNLSNNYFATPLHFSAYMKDHLIIAILLDFGAKVNEIDSNDMTPLMYSVMRQDRLAIEFLVEYGANVDYVNRDGITSISIAEEYGDKNIITYLKSRSFMQKQGAII